MATSNIKAIAPMIEAKQTTTGQVQANSYIDVDMTFSKKFTKPPVVVCSLLSTSTAGAIGSMTASAINITTTGFTARIFNAGSAARAPSLSWVAIEN